MPTRRFDDGEWLHPSRLPLGAGWEGYCTAPGHEGSIPDRQQLQQDCNLGYASACPRLPAQRAWDTVRFCVSRQEISVISLAYVCERNHLPREHGMLEYRLEDRRWVKPHGDRRIQAMAECFLDSWLRRRQVSSAETPIEDLHERS
jgi:hypothetical protein